VGPSKAWFMAHADAGVDEQGGTGAAASGRTVAAKRATGGQLAMGRGRGQWHGQERAHREWGAGRVSGVGVA
jgi:uncharacterized protein (UPF0548 family)